MSHSPQVAVVAFPPGRDGAKLGRVGAVEIASGFRPGRAMSMHVSGGSKSPR